MGNGAVGNGGKVKQFFKDIGTGIKDGLNTVVDFGKKIIGAPGVKDAINMGAAAFGVPVPVGDMISSGVKDATPTEIIKYLNFMKHTYDVQQIKNNEAHNKYLITELCKKRDNQVYKGKSIVERYEQAVRDNEVTNSTKPYWKVSDEDELDGC
jgi:hypothetical protein